MNPFMSMIDSFSKVSMFRLSFRSRKIIMPIKRIRPSKRIEFENISISEKTRIPDAADFSKSQKLMEKSEIGISADVDILNYIF